MKALIIFSGGQDSTTCLGWALNRFLEVEAITFKYGQNHDHEVEQAKVIIEKYEYGIPHHVIDISFFADIVDSALTSKGDVNSPHNRLKHLPASFVPNRNAMFITIAHALAQKIGADKLITGVCETDYSGYPDCRNVFIKSIEQSLNLGSETTIEILTPLMYLNKAEIWALAEAEGCINTVMDYSLTCYNGIFKSNDWGMGCGDCPACKLRAKGFNEYKEKRNG